MNIKNRLHHALFSTALVLSFTANAESMSNADVAQQLQNPLANLISAPIQLNYDSNIGVDDKGSRYLANIQPVIPFDMSDDWLAISRTILPVIKQNDIIPSDSSQFGVGDIVQTVFFSPKEPTDNGWIWGAGPVLLIPSASNDYLGTKKWGAGASIVALKQQKAWTFGFLANHIVDFAGDNDRSDINATYLQPFIGYTWPSATGLFLLSETTIDWENDTKSIPINLVLSQVTQVGGQTFSFGIGARYWLDSPDSGPEGFGVRLVMTWLIPK